MSISDRTPRTLDIPVTGGVIHAVEVGDKDADPVMLLHGWPGSAATWNDVMHLAAPTHRAIALDLPGIGRSRLNTADGRKSYLAALIREAIETLDIEDRRLTLVGQDVGGMATLAYLRTQPAPRAAVIMNTALPGLTPWDAVVANPWIWHFAFHSIPGLPETLVADHTAEYFDYFYEAIAAQPERITPAQRAAHAQAYVRPEALRQGFEFYRAFRSDIVENTPPVLVETPLLYLRGDSEGGDIAVYAEGLRASGVATVLTGIIEGSGHFAPEEQPERTWTAIATHIADCGRTADPFVAHD